MEPIHGRPTIGRRTSAAEPVQEHATALGSVAHQLIAELVTDLRDRDEPAVLIDLWARAGRLATRERFGSRARAARISAAGAAATYRRYFLPTPDWTILGVELPIDGGRVDIAWEGPGSVIVFDEIKLAFGRSRARGAGPTDRQVRGYLAHGEAAFGERFGGVRLLLLGAPRYSMLIGPGSQLRRLSETALWFGAEAS